MRRKGLTFLCNISMIPMQMKSLKDLMNSIYIFVAENIEIVGGIDIEQAENDRDIRDDVEVGWSREDTVSLISPFLYLSCDTHR